MTQNKYPVVQGQRTNFTLDGAGKLVTVIGGAQPWQPVARGENNKHNAWQVTLAPITQQGISSVLEGMPAWRPTPTSAGAISTRLTFGGGGVSFQFHFPWPVNGGSFGVSGDNIMVEAVPLDGATVFTEATKPCASGWLKPTASPTSRDPLVVWNLIPNNTDLPIEPFTRAIVVGHRTAGANVIVTFKGAAGALTLAVVELPASRGVERIPIPVGAETYRVNASDGAPVYAGRELSFT